MTRVTPEKIKELNTFQCFLFGSNEAGQHGAGAAALAFNKFGAEWGVGFGPTGKCFALPTKDWDINSLSLDVIEMYVDRFVAYARGMKNTEFLVTKIGTGLAGFSIDDIAPMFREAIDMPTLLRAWKVIWVKRY